MPPIKPSQISIEKEKFIPEEVFDAFNELIVANWNGSSSRIKQCDIVNRIMKKLNVEGDTTFIFKNHYLDVEDIYRKQGWKVYYDKPAYFESYEPTFEFSVEK